LKNPEAILVLSGGIGLTADSNQKPITESDAMYEYIKSNYPDFPNEILKENQSTGSLEQLCLIKENYILPKNLQLIAIVSDEFHIKRIAVLFDAVLGNGYSVYNLGIKINLFGKYRQLLEDYELANYTGALELVQLLPKGDHSRFKNFDKAYRELRKLKLEQGESRLDFISPKEVVGFMDSSDKYF
jgi:hypothetical protein